MNQLIKGSRRPEMPSPLRFKENLGPVISFTVCRPNIQPPPPPDGSCGVQKCLKVVSEKSSCVCVSKETIKKRGPKEDRRLGFETAKLLILYRDVKKSPVEPWRWFWMTRLGVWPLVYKRNNCRSSAKKRAKKCNWHLSIWNYRRQYPYVSSGVCFLPNSSTLSSPLQNPWWILIKHLRMNKVDRFWMIWTQIADIELDDSWMHNAWSPVHVRWHQGNERPLSQLRLQFPRHAVATDHRLTNACTDAVLFWKRTYFRYAGKWTV